MKQIFFILTFSLTLLLSVEPTRIMPLGDSITYDDSYADYPSPRPASLRHAYRDYLWYKLKDAHYHVDFVGSRNAGSAIVPPFDPHNEGYPGWTSQQIANITYSKLIANPPDIVLLHIGSNDWDDDVRGINNILNEIARYEQNYHHPIKVILARIINRRQHYDWISSLNRNIQTIANNRIRSGDNIVVVNMEYGAGIHYTNDFQDPTHPNNTGYNKMANVWFSALSHILSPVPNQPTSFQVTSLESKMVTLSWGDTSNNETSYEIYQNGILIATLSANTTQYIVTNLKRVTSYTYTIIALNPQGNSIASSISVRTKDDYGWLVPVTYIINN